MITKQVTPIPHAYSYSEILYDLSNQYKNWESSGQQHLANQRNLATHSNPNPYHHWRYRKFWIMNPNTRSKIGMENWKKFYNRIFRFRKHQIKTSSRMMRFRFHFTQNISPSFWKNPSLNSKLFLWRVFMLSLKTTKIFYLTIALQFIFSQKTSIQ